MTRSITRAIAGLAVAAGAAAVIATPAVAAAAAPPATADIFPLSSSAPAGLDVLRGKYWTLSGCQTAGRQGIERGHWSQFQCAEGRLQWVLWTDR